MQQAVNPVDGVGIAVSGDRRRPTPGPRGTHGAVERDLAGVRVMSGRSATNSS